MVFIGLLSLQAQAADIGTGISYQGRLDDTNAPASGSYDFQFTLYDNVTAGTQVGNTLPQTLTVTDGIFNTTLDFGAGAFNNQARFLEIDVRVSGSGGYSTLSPRQAITTVPNASSVKSIGNVVTVAKSGGDYSDISDTMASITDATAANPYVIRIGPGIFVENDGIDLKSFVDLEGSGEGITIIRGDGSADSPFGSGTSATVRAGNIIVELSHLTVESSATASNTNAVAIRTNSSTDELKLRYLTTVSAGGTSQTFGVMNIQASPHMEFVTSVAAATNGNSFGIYNWSNSNPYMRHITAKSTSGTTSSGIRNQTNSKPMMSDLNASGTGGSGNNFGLEIFEDTAGSELVIRNSTFTGATAGVSNGGSLTEPPLVKLLSSQVNGPVSDFVESAAPISSKELDFTINTAISNFFNPSAQGTIAWIGENRLFNQAEIALKMTNAFPGLTITHETFDHNVPDQGEAEYKSRIQARYDQGVRRFLLGDFSSRLNLIIDFLNGPTLVGAQFVSANSNGSSAKLNAFDRLERLLPRVDTFGSVIGKEIQKVSPSIEVAIFVHSDSEYSLSLAEGIQNTNALTNHTLELTSAQLNSGTVVLGTLIESYLNSLPSLPGAVMLADSGQFSTEFRKALEIAESNLGHTFQTRWVSDSFFQVNNGFDDTIQTYYSVSNVFLANSDFVESVEAATPIQETRERMYIEALRYLAYDRILPEGLGISGPIDLVPGGDRNKNFFYQIHNNTLGVDEGIGFFE